MNCPRCNSNKIRKDGKTIQKKQRWKCKKCGRSFINRKYPPTSYPFEFIAFVLNLRRSASEKNQKKPSKKSIEKLLKNMDLEFKKIPRQTIHNWEKKYANTYGDYVSEIDANRYVISHFTPRLKQKTHKIKKTTKTRFEKRTSQIQKLYQIEIKLENGVTAYKYPYGEQPSHRDLKKSIRTNLCEAMDRDKANELFDYIINHFTLLQLHKFYIKLNYPEL